jgi:uncharacterized protein (DUF4415 family)
MIEGRFAMVLNVRTKPRVVMPTPEEDAAIARGIAQDPDTYELTDEELARLRPASEVPPQIMGEANAAALMKRRGRPAVPADSRKVPTTIRLDPDVVEAFRETGPGWQSRMNGALREWAMGHGLIRARRR